MKNDAQPISRDEWERIVNLTPFTDTFPVIRSDTVDDLERRINGAKFTYMSHQYSYETIYTLVGKHGDGVLILGYKDGVFSKLEIP